MHPHLPNGPEQAKHVERMETRERKSVIVDVPRHVERQGGTRNKTMRVVCKRCNGGWMSSIEEAAKPIMIPMMRGDAVRLDADSKEKLTHWIALKTMVADANVTGDTVLTGAERSAFMSDRVLPSSFSAYVGRTSGKLWSTRFHRHAATLGLSSDAQIPLSGKNTQTIIFGANELFVVAFLDAAKVGLQLDAKIQTKVPLLHPDRGEVLSWPPAESLLDIEAAQVATGLDRLFQSPRVRWMQ